MITKYMLLILKLYIEYMVHSFWQLNYPLIYLSSVYETESLPPPSLTISCCFLLHFVTTERLKQAKDWRPADHQKLFRCPDCSCFTPYKKFPTHFMRFLNDSSVLCLEKSSHQFIAFSFFLFPSLCNTQTILSFAWFFVLRPPTAIILVLVCHQVRITCKRYVN